MAFSGLLYLCRNNVGMAVVDVRLQVLHLAYNTIGTEGFSAIAQALPHLRYSNFLKFGALLRF